ncbi:MAG TPA: hypothetical protein VLI93_07340, partial [Acetobacteraceae bacterium]|nr:hypothetical protein [Acetobacteraceae bacterium]
MKQIAKRGILWAGVLVGTLIGVLIVAACSRDFAQITRAGWQHWLLLSAVVLAATALVAAPCIGFLLTGWSERLDEFKNAIRDGAIRAYLKQFWERRLDEKPDALANTRDAEDLFDAIYVSHNGRQAFIAPVILLLAVTFLSAMLVGQT